MRAADFEEVFYPGGQGPLWDLAEDAASIALIDAMIAAGKPVAAVCHAPGVLLRAKAPGGQALARGKQLTGFSNTEEQAAGLTDVLPFLVEDMLMEQGGRYSKAADWQPLVLTDGVLITGQNRRLRSQLPGRCWLSCAPSRRDLAVRGGTSQKQKPLNFTRKMKG